MIQTALKAIGLIFVIYVLFNWMTAGQDEIIEGPIDPSSTQKAVIE